MYNKTIILLFTIVFLNACGFAPMYSDIKEKNFNIIITEKNGDRDTNNLIESNLKNYFNKQNDNIFKLKLTTNFEKKSIAKNSSGKTTDYELKIIANFEIEDRELIKNITFSETFNYRSIDDKLTELNYENSIKKNMVEIIIKKLISNLSRIK